MKLTPTKHSTVKDKERFIKHFIKFVNSDFKFTMFPKWFYTRLSMCFGNIAHYNIFGFYDVFFTSTERKVNFLNSTLNWSCYGDPGFTFCDAEKEIQTWLINNNILEAYQRLLNDETEIEEKKEYKRLKEKYEIVGA